MGRGRPFEPADLSARARLRDLRRTAFILTRQSDREAAAASWERVAAIDADDSVARLALGRIYAQLDRPALALLHLAAIPASAANYPNAHKLGTQLAKRELRRLAGQIAVRPEEDLGKLLNAIKTIIGNDLLLTRPGAAVAPPRALVAEGEAASEPEWVSQADAVELAAQLANDDRELSEVELTEIGRRLSGLLPVHPCLLQALSLYYEKRNRTSDFLQFLKNTPSHLLGSAAWIEAAQSAGLAGDFVAAREFCERAFRRANCSVSSAAAVTPVLRELGLDTEAIAIWKRVREKGNALRARLGLIRLLHQTRRRKQLVSEGLEILDCFLACESLDAADQRCLAEIARRTAAALQSGFSEADRSTLPRIVESGEKGAWADWLRALFANAAGDTGRALAALENARGQSALPHLDFNAEIGLLHAQRHHFGAAFAAFAEADPNVLAENLSYARPLEQIKAVAELCGTGSSVLYPEALIDIALHEISLLPARYEPQPGTLLTVCATLGQGGGERQTITVLRRLVAHPGVASVNLAVRSTEKAGQSFFLPQLRQIPLEPIVYGQNCPNEAINDAAFRTAFPSDRLRRAIELLPRSLREEVVQLLSVILERRPAAVHIRQDMAACALACALAGVPHILVHRGSLSPDRWAHTPLQAETHLRPMRHIYRRLLETAGLLIVNNSRAGSDSDRSWLDWPDRDRFRVVYNATEFDSWRVDADSRKDSRAALGIGDEDFVVGGVFRLVAVKRPLFWMEVAAEIAARCPQAHFLILGDGEYAPAMREFAGRRGFAGRLHMPGQVEDVAPWYCAMDLNLLTSEREGLPNVLIEGQHFGVPALASDVGGARETLDPELTGRLLPHDAIPGQFAQVALSLWRDEAWRERAREAAPGFVRGRFGAGHAAEALLDCFGFAPAPQPARVESAVVRVAAEADLRSVPPAPP